MSTAGPKIHDPGPHVRVGREPRPRPALTGVSTLLERQRGETVASFPCFEGRVEVLFGWRLTEEEKASARAAAGRRSGAPHEQVIEALADLFRRDLTFRLATTVEVHPVERVALRGREEAPC